MYKKRNSFFYFLLSFLLILNFVFLWRYLYISKEYSTYVYKDMKGIEYDLGKSYKTLMVDLRDYSKLHENYGFCFKSSNSLKNINRFFERFENYTKGESEYFFLANRTLRTYADELEHLGFSAFHNNLPSKEEYDSLRGDAQRFIFIMIKHSEQYLQAFESNTLKDFDFEPLEKELMDFLDKNTQIQ